MEFCLLKFGDERELISMKALQTNHSSDAYSVEFREARSTCKEKE
jgi:hypothetical protein